MIETQQAMVAICLVALLVYLTRVGGYLVGLQFKHVLWLRPILETLPGCAMMAILAQAAWSGSMVERIALASVIGIMWLTDSVALASLCGLAILFFSTQWI